MKNFALLLLLILLSQTAFAQKPRSRAPRKNNLAANKSVKEKEALEAAVALEDKAERANALRKFAADYPRSKELTRAAELLVVTLAALADEKMQAGDQASGIELFKRAVADAPLPISDKLFAEVLAQIPNSLLMRGQTAAAIETAQTIEAKVEGNAKQTLALAGFYLNLENAAEAKRLTEKSLTLAPDLPAAYQTLGLAERINFDLDEAVVAYEKALELDANSTVSKRSLAEMKRAVGKPSEAAALYREILAGNENDNAARTGLILALFDDEKQAEAESAMQQSLDANPNNLPLLVGAAYWYAAHNDGAKAVETAEKAVRLEPRYTWAHIALARGLIAQKRPLDAEKALLMAQRYGNFPTLEYELAAARFQTGFYREAAEGLAKTFTIRDGLIETKLGGRVSKAGKNFIELLSYERRASIFQPLAADKPEDADKLKALLDFYLKIQTAPNDEAVLAKADEFIKGEDKMKLHRQLFVAGNLLNKKSNLPKVLELTKAAATGGVDAGLNVENPAAAVLADELYENRKIALTRGELIVVPEVSKLTLSNILRGRIEDLAGWTLFQEGKPSEAVVRLKRAVSVLPAGSSWWRESQWRLGTALDANEKSKDALEAYVKGYVTGKPDAAKYAVVETLYRKINGSTDGLEAKVGEKPAPVKIDAPVQAEQTVAQTTAPETAKPEPTPNAEPVAENDSLGGRQIPPSPVVEAKPTPTEVVPNELTAGKTAPAPTPGIKVEEPPVAETAAPSEAKKPEPTPEIVSVETAPDEIKVAADDAPDEIVTAPEKVAPKLTETPAPPVEPAQKPLFDPIIITVPRADVRPAKKTSEETGESRPRVVASPEPELIPPCRILVNQETASIIGDGGSLALITELLGDGDVKEIRAISSDPANVEAAFDSEIGGLTKRALFIVKSISQKKGAFTVTFEMPCGKKEVSVSVR